MDVCIHIYGSIRPANPPTIPHHRAIRQPPPNTHADVHVDAMDVAGDNQMKVEHNMLKQRLSPGA